jgi:hypothetical protein
MHYRITKNASEYATGAKSSHRYARYTSRSGFGEYDWLSARNLLRKSAWRRRIRNGYRSSISEQAYISIQLRGHLDGHHRKSYTDLGARQLQASPTRGTSDYGNCAKQTQKHEEIVVLYNEMSSSISTMTTAATAKNVDFTKIQ